MATGQGLVDRARSHIGERYVNVLVPKDAANWRGPWDCAEFVSWVVFQEAGILYGCSNNNAAPSRADAYTGAWQRDVQTLGQPVSVSEAAATPGGIVLRYPPAPGKMGHIAICDGRGGTIEAKGVRYGVVADTVRGRRWDTGVLVPRVSYSAAQPLQPLPALPVIYRTGAAGLDREIVRAIQQALARYQVADNPRRFLDPGPIDGLYGDRTAAAVSAFQALNGLVVDGEVGPATAAELQVQI